MLCQLSYRGRQPADCTGRFSARLAFEPGREEDAASAANTARHATLRRRRRCAVCGRLRVRTEAPLRPTHGSPRSRWRSERTGFDPGPVDGVAGPLTRGALASFQRARKLRPDGKLDRATRRALGARGRPLLGQRELAVGAVGWDVAVLEFRLRRYGFPARAVDGRFDAATAAALRRFQRRRALDPDGIAGPNTYRALARRAPVRDPHRPLGESFFSIAARYHVSPWLLARGIGSR